MSIFEFIFFIWSYFMLANSYQVLDNNTCRENPFARTFNQPPSVLFNLTQNKNNKGQAANVRFNQSICYLQIQSSSRCEKSALTPDGIGQCDLINCDPYQFNETHNGVIITSTKVLTQVYDDVTIQTCEDIESCDVIPLASISLKNCSFKSIDSYTEISKYSVSYGQSTTLTCVKGSKLVETPTLIHSNFADLTCGNCSEWITKVPYCVIGDKADFNCTTNQPDVFESKSPVFFLNGAEISSDGISKIHLNSDNNDNKVYCKWHLGSDNESDFLSSEETTINVTYGPKNVIIQLNSTHPFHVFNDKVFLNSSQTVSVSCYGNANPDTLSCVWFVNNKNTFEKCVGDFSIDTASNVFCEASNNVGFNVSKTTEIIVVETRKVNISTAGYDKHQVEGKDLNLVCNIPYQKELETKFQWTIPNDMRTDINLALSHLMLSNLTRKDKGTYRCETTDTFGSYSSTTDIEILYGPYDVTTSFDENNTNVKVSGNIVLLNSDQTVTMHCLSDANPKSDCSFNVSETVLTTTNCSASYHFSNNNDVTCSANNSFGQRDSMSIDVVIVESRTSVKENLTSLQTPIKTGDDVTLNCSIPYYEEMETFFEWIILMNEDLENNNPILKLSSITRHDLGNYTCRTEDKFGESLRSTYLNILFAPETLENTTNCSWKDVEDLKCYVIFTANPQIVNYTLTREETLVSCPDCKLTAANESLTQKFVLITKITSGSTDFKLYLSAALDFPDLIVTFKISDETINDSFINVGLILGCVLGISSVLIIILGVLLFLHKESLCKDSKKVEENFDVVDIDSGSHVYQNTAATNSGSTEQKQDNYENVEFRTDPEHHYETEIEFSKYENYRTEKAEENKYEEMRPSK